MTREIFARALVSAADEIRFGFGAARRDARSRRAEGGTLRVSRVMTGTKMPGSVPMGSERPAVRDGVTVWCSENRTPEGTSHFGPLM
jgi:hypothetical protein